MSGVTHIQVTESDEGQRLDRWLKKHVSHMPYGVLMKAIRTGQIRVDGGRAKADTRLRAGQDIRIPPHDDRAKDKAPAPLNEDEKSRIRDMVIYDDGDIVAINKPAGLAAQGGGALKTHVDRLLPALKKGESVPRLVHRLDMETSGAMVMARSAEVVRNLGKAFRDRDVKKLYWAVVTPAPEQMEGTITAPVGKPGGPHKDKMMVDEDEGKSAITDFHVIERMGNKGALVVFWPRTGRTHQIRVHAAYMGCPIMGDTKYHGVIPGRTDMEEGDFAGLDLSERLHLHAYRLILPHSVTGKGDIDLRAPLPDDLRATWKAFDLNARTATDPFED